MKNTKEIIASTFRVKSADIKDSTEIQDIDSWDSLTHMELIANLEQEFGIEFDVDEIMEMIRIDVIQKIIDGKLANGN